MQMNTPNPDEESEAVYRQFDPTTDSVVDEVLTAVAGVRDLELTEITPLAEAIDPDALEELFDPIGRGVDGVAGYVSFVYDGLKIVVESQGAVHVTTV